MAVSNHVRVYERYLEELQDWEKSRIRKVNTGKNVSRREVNHCRHFSRVEAQLDYHHYIIKPSLIDQTFNYPLPKELDGSVKPAKAPIDFTKEQKEDMKKAIGCQACYEKVYKLANTVIKRYNYKKGIKHDAERVQDTLQDVLLKANKDLQAWKQAFQQRKITTDTESKKEYKLPDVESYFKAIIKNKYKDTIKAEIKRIDLSERIAIDEEEENLKIYNGEKSLLDFKDVELYHDLKNKLNDGEFKLLLLRWQGYTVREVAKSLKMSKSNIHKKESIIYKQCHDIANAIKS